MYYGLDPKQIMEEHVAIADTAPPLLLKHFELLSPTQFPRLATVLFPARHDSEEGLCDSIRALVNASMSAVRIPALDIGHFFVWSDFANQGFSTGQYISSGVSINNFCSRWGAPKLLNYFFSDETPFSTISAHLFRGGPQARHTHGVATSFTISARR